MTIRSSTADPNAPLSQRATALADPAVPQIFKDLERIIAEKGKDEFQHLVRTGAVDPLAVAPAHPFLSPVSQVMGLPAEEAREWLRILFEKAPEKIAEAKCPCYGFSRGYFTVDPDNRNPYYATELETPALVAVLASRTETPVMDMAKISLTALGALMPDRYNETGEPLLHQLYNSREFSTATFDNLEKLAGNTDFLMIKNSRGETLFHRVASFQSWGEDLVKLDVASWMLQRRPELVNEPDRFGWTPLDRLLSQSQGRVDTSMGRLLIVSGARLAKQIAPQFNLAAALEEYGGSRLEKPAPRKAAPSLKPL